MIPDRPVRDRDHPARPRPRCFHAEETDFDVDLRELQGQERLDVFCRCLRDRASAKSRDARFVILGSREVRGVERRRPHEPEC